LPALACYAGTLPYSSHYKVMYISLPHVYFMYISSFIYIYICVCVCVCVCVCIYIYICMPIKMVVFWERLRCGMMYIKPTNLYTRTKIQDSRFYALPIIFQCLKHHLQGVLCLTTLKNTFQVLKTTLHSFKVVHKIIISTPHMLMPVDLLTNILKSFLKCF
jgi:hypothetical protein